MGSRDPVIRAYPVSSRYILVFVERTPYGSVCKKLTIAGARRFAMKAIEAATILKGAIEAATTLKGAIEKAGRKTKGSKT